MNSQAIDEAFLQLDRWITENGWAGYDPYDIRGQDWFVKLFGSQTAVHRKIRGALALAERNLPPHALRKLLRIKKEINPKGMGLIASAYLARYKSTGDTPYLTKAEGILAWLSANGIRQSYPGISWGYPFHWQSRMLIPRDTPSVVVTGTVGDAWLDHYELTSSADSLQTANDIAEFVLHGLNRSVDENHLVCFSYTPLDRYRVHNANLFAAAFLARLFALTEEPKYRRVALKAVSYTLSEQNPDGSFYYWGSETPTIIDHYHTGFVLRHLDTVRRSLPEESIVAALTRAYDYYLKQMFTDEFVPLFTADSLYPIDIHSCAEAILCLCQLGPDFGGVDRIAPVVEFVQERMRTAEGWYIAEIRRRCWGEQRVKVPYMRWSQAWMLLAFARLGNNKCASG